MVLSLQELLFHINCNFFTYILSLLFSLKFFLSLFDLYFFSFLISITTLSMVSACCYVLVFISKMIFKICFFLFFPMFCQFFTELLSLTQILNFSVSNLCCSFKVSKCCSFRLIYNVRWSVSSVLWIWRLCVIQLLFIFFLQYVHMGPGLSFFVVFVDSLCSTFRTGSQREWEWVRAHLYVAHLAPTWELPPPAIPLKH